MSCSPLTTARREVCPITWDGAVAAFWMMDYPRHFMLRVLLKSDPPGVDPVVKMSEFSNWFFGGEVESAQLSGPKVTSTLKFTNVPSSHTTFFVSL